jgi:hypothetical protein
MSLPIVLSIYMSLATTSLAAEDQVFSHSRALPPLRLAASDLDAILHKTHSSIAAANGPASPKDSPRESVTIGVNGKEIEIPHFSLASSVAFPRELFRFSYNYNRQGKPISSVVLDLGDYSRRIVVSGGAADQVEAIAKSIEADLLRYSTVIGGATLRNVTGASLSVVLVTSVVGSSVYWWNARSNSALGMLICSAIGLALLLLVPWRRYFPGFVLYQSYSPFFLVRYAPQICLVSLFASVAGIPVSYLFLRSRGQT